MLDGEHARGERVLVIVGVHRDRALRDNRAVIEIRGHEMHGAAVDAHAIGERAAVGVQARDRREATKDGC